MVGAKLLLAQKMRQRVNDCSINALKVCLALLAANAFAEVC